MKKGWGLLLAVSLVVAPSLAQKVHIDYDQEAAFGAYKTFQFQDTPEMSVQDAQSTDTSYLNISGLIYIDDATKAHYLWFTSNGGFATTFNVSSSRISFAKLT